MPQKFHDLMFFIQLIWWLEHVRFLKIWLNVSNFAVYNIKFIWFNKCDQVNLSISVDVSIVDWTHICFCIFVGYKLFVKTFMSVSFFVLFIFVFFCVIPSYFCQKPCFNWFLVITELALLTLVFTRGYISSTEFF